MDAERKQAGVPCKNYQCKFWDERYEQNCCAGDENDNPGIVDCKHYIPDNRTVQTDGKCPDCDAWQKDGAEYCISCHRVFQVSGEIMKTPPKNGTMIIGVFGSYPTPLACMWNGTDGKWNAAVPHCEPVNGVWEDFYFENEPFTEEEMERWRLIE